MISFYITTYNSARLLKQILDDFNKQSCRDFEVVIVDAGSDDDIISVVSQMENKIDVKLYHAGYVSIYAGLNRALGICRGTHCVCVGSDDRIVDVHYVENLISRVSDLNTLYFTDIDIRRNNLTISRKKFPDLPEFQRKYGGLAHLHHQSVIIPRWYLAEQQYDETYKYYSDLNLIFKAQLDLHVERLNISGVLFNAHGTSSSLNNSVKRLCEIVTLRRKYSLFPLHFRILASFFRQMLAY